MSETPQAETPHPETPQAEPARAETARAETARAETGARASAPDRRKSQGSAGGGDAVYGLGLIGALVYFVQQADGFVGVVLAVLKALLWPAFLVYEAFRAVHGS
jgi:hypothetical protein